MSNRFTVIFMGTPDFSVPALRALAAHDCDIPLVITQPDRPKGRGRVLFPPPVKIAALELGIHVLQPKKLNTPEVVGQIRSLSPDFFVVVAFGQILSQEMLRIPRIYPINIHASLLPAYRGASPIHSAILNGETQTGITTMIMDRTLDTGDILLMSSTPISDNETTQNLHDRLAIMGADMIIKTLDGLRNNSIIPRPQDNAMASYAPMLKKEDGKIDWESEPGSIHSRVRAMTPWPGAFTFHGNERLKLFIVKPGFTPTDALPGTILAADAQGIRVAAGNGTITILELQGAAGKRLRADEYLRGKTLSPGTRFHG
ncbi:MAG: methionyl-tRNA formyltransferase [Pseudomonadota bacterium]